MDPNSNSRSCNMKQAGRFKCSLCEINGLYEINSTERARQKLIGEYNKCGANLIYE